MTTKIPAELSSTPGIADSSNATAITIDSSERIGVGTTSPTFKLDVNGSLSSNGNENVMRIAGSDTNNAGGITINAVFGSTAASRVMTLFSIDGQDQASPLAFGSGTSEKIRITSAGKVGIGLTSPQAVLDVVSSGATSTAFRVLKSGTSTQNLHAATEISGHGRFSIYDSSENEDIRFDSNGDSYFNGGDVGIGTTSPTTKLEVQETTGTVFAGRFFHGSNPSSSPPQGVRVDFGYTPNNGTSEFLKCRDSVNSSAVNRAVIMSNGGIGNFTTNDFNYSDERMKKDINNATAQLDNVKKLQLKTFRYKEQEDSEPTNLGVVAQDIQTDFPALVTEQGEGDEARLGVKEQQIMWMAVKAIQEQQDIIEDLKSRIETLEG
jgi:hypothetical protein